MPKNQKARILYLRDYLLENTDAQHAVSLKQIREHLEQRLDETVDRKTIYDDLDTLEYLGGMELERGRGNYKVLTRDFDFSELQILTDLLQSSKFISAEKSRELINKLKKLTSVHEARKLQRSVNIIHRVKSADEQMLPDVGEIASAIEDRVLISFRYLEYDLRGELVPRHKTPYRVAPFYLVTDDDNYYLLGWDTARDALRTYRVDKMEEVHRLKTARTPAQQQQCDAIDIGKYGRMAFGMFGGEAVRVKIRFPNALAGAAYDVLGREIFVVPDGPDHFTALAEVIPSPHFFGWIAALGGTEILEPVALREKMKKNLEENLALYE